MAELNENIESYFKSLEIQLLSISKIEAPEYLKEFKKVLYISFIDQLSSLVYPKQPNRKRVIQVLKKFSSWDDGNRISLPHLLRLLRISNEPAFKKLKFYAKRKLKSWKSGEIIKISNDLKFGKLIDLWPQIAKDKLKIGDIRIENFSHFALFYSYRNCLIHELKAPAFDVGMNLEKYPFYVHMSDYKEDDSIENHWTLNYPTEFFNTISKNILKELKSYMLKKELDPYKDYMLKHYYIEGLNK